jgi:hypothetical protein
MSLKEIVVPGQTKLLYRPFLMKETNSDDYGICFKWSEWKTRFKKKVQLPGFSQSNGKTIEINAILIPEGTNRRTGPFGRGWVLECKRGVMIALTIADGGQANKAICWEPDESSGYYIDSSSHAIEHAEPYSKGALHKCPRDDLFGSIGFVSKVTTWFNSPLPGNGQPKGIVHQGDRIDIKDGAVECRFLLPDVKRFKLEK